jgi:CheY-like chemotaxis protein
MQLKKLGYSTIIAENGLDAIDKFKSNRGLIDLIFMDNNMPIMDGIEATKKIKELDKKIQIVGYSAMMAGEGREEYELAAIDAGINYFLSKPYKQKDLDEILKITKLAA